MKWLVPAAVNVALIILTGYKAEEPRFWILLGILLVYQIVWALLNHSEGFKRGLERK